MPKHLFTRSKSRFWRYLYWPICKIGSWIIPPGNAEPYSFNRAKKYWQNVPRAKGGNPFNSGQLEHIPDEDLLQEFDKEMAIARRKKERELGFALAIDSIANIDGPEVMDYGSGIGFYGFEILDRHPGACVTFVDISDTNLAAIKRIARAKELSNRVSCVVVKDEQARDLIFDKQFDLITSMGVLHHTPYAPEIVRNLTKFLKLNGIFQVMLYNDTYLRQMEIMAGRQLNVSSFGTITDPVVGDLKNPYSEAYDDIKAQSLFEGHELISADYPTSFYNTYRFRKIASY